jgi:hypothetical protein
VKYYIRKWEFHTFFYCYCKEFFIFTHSHTHAFHYIPCIHKDFSLLWGFSCILISCVIIINSAAAARRTTDDVSFCRDLWIFFNCESNQIKCFMRKRIRTKINVEKRNRNHRSKNRRRKKSWDKKLSTWNIPIISEIMWIPFFLSLSMEREWNKVAWVRGVEKYWNSLWFD